MSASNSKADEVFGAALAIEDAVERAAYLQQACGDDAALRAEVESLLASSAQAGAFLETPAQADAARVDGADGGREGMVAPPEQPGERIGRYRLLEKIGEGGMGVVWMAEQEEPMRRRVALKIIKLGMDTKEVIARCEAERQALAMMDHANIAKVFDGGAAESGRPYFVMELVRGVRGTDYCDQQGLSTTQRLELFMQVCQAVQHAHQKGIIHRDLKPSNILVTVNEGVAVTKVIDFGIAKATDQRLTDKTLFTRFLQFMGTPAYMSPEQAELASVDIDTRSDIYALGVLLYELLTGHTPFDTKELLKQGYDAVRRTIRDVDPPKPSTRLKQKRLLQSGASSTSQIANRKSEIDPDLDWIVMKCLEKDRGRRYETANTLVADVQRHLDHKPILARPPSVFYQWQKFLRRHRTMVRATAVLASGLVASWPIALVVVRTHRNRLAVLEAKADAWDYQRPTLNPPERREAMLRSIETSVSNLVRREGASNVDRRNLTYEMARAYLHSQRFAEAEKLYRDYLAPLRATGLTNHSQLSGVLSGLTQALQGQGKYAETEPLLREYLAIVEQRPDDDWHIGKVRARLGSVLLGQKKFREAEPILIQGYERMVRAERPVAKEIRQLRVPYETQAGEWIIQLYLEWGKRALADEWRKRVASATNAAEASTK
jgi:serine/threonine protein kinase